MCRMFGYVANDPALIRCALAPSRRLMRAAHASDGWGLGFYQGGEILLQRYPRPFENGVNFYERVSELRSDLVVGHVRTATVGGQSGENTHPYRFRNWLFAHNGTLARFHEIEPRIVEHIPEFLLRNVRGQTDSEILFHLFLTQLHDDGYLEDREIPVKAATEALRKTTAFVDNLLGEPCDMNVVTTNGQILLATTRRRPLALIEQRGIQRCEIHSGGGPRPNQSKSDPAVTGASPAKRQGRRSPTPEPLAGANKPVPHEHLRSVLLISEPQLQDPSINPLAQNLAEEPARNGEGDKGSATSAPRSSDLPTFQPTLRLIPDNSIVEVRKDLSTEVVSLR